MKRLDVIAFVGIGAAFATAAAAGDMPEPLNGTVGVASHADAFAASDGIVDLMVTGPAAKALYDRLPGKGNAQACGASGLHKGNGRISCVRRYAHYSCHLWLDVPKQELTDPETDDC